MPESALPQYMQAIEMAGGEPVRIALDHSPIELAKLVEGCDAVVLPGSKADVDPAAYHAAKRSEDRPRRFQTGRGG